MIRARRIRSEKLIEHHVGAGETGIGGKCKRSVWLRESGVKEPKECVVER